MFMDGVRTVAWDSEPVEYCRTGSRREISIGRSPNLRFSQLETQFSSDRTCLFVQRHRLLAAFERRTVNAAANDQLDAFVEAAKIQDLTFDTLSFFTRTEANVNFSA